MKKIICGLGSFLLICSTTFSVISCQPKIHSEVTLELQTDNQGSSIVKAYRQVVDSFNKDRPNNPLKLKLLVSSPNSIKDKIATGTQLPNLYTAYADLMSTYDILLRLRDNQSPSVNMAEVINWDNHGKWWENSADNWLEAYVDNGNKVNPHGLTGKKTLNEVTGNSASYRPFLNSFLQEGLVSNGSTFMYSAPTIKSNFIGVVNLRLLNELVTNVLGPEAKLQVDNRSIRKPYFIKKSQKNLKNILINSEQNNFQLSVRNHYKDDFKLTFGKFFEQLIGPKTSFELQKFLGDLSNVEILLSSYWNLVGSQEGNTQDKWIKTFAFGTDDINATAGLMQGQLSGDSKQFISWDPEQPYKLFINAKDKNLHRGLEDFIDFVRWGNDNKELLNDSSSASDHGNGGIGVKANSISKDYYSNQWIKQGMLFYYGSSSGVKFMSGTKDNQVHNDDILLAPIPIYESTLENPDWSLLFRQQGAGLGMFKDENVLKNQIAIDFLNYFLSPKVNLEFAIQTGYLPTNYKVYYSDEKSNQLNGPYYHELLKGDLGKIKGSNIIRNLIEQLAEKKIKLWFTEVSPFAEAVNYQVLQPWFQKNYKTFLDGSPNSQNLTWNQFEKDFHQEVKRIINSMLPGISHIVWNGTLEE